MHTLDLATVFDIRETMPQSLCKVAFCDLDGVVADSTQRFEQAKATYADAWEDRQVALGEKEQAGISRYWQTAFNPDLIPLDTLIEGAGEALAALEEEGFTIYFLTSRPESLRTATLAWLQDHGIWSPHSEDSRRRRLIMKPQAAQFIKTPTWKALAIQMLADMYGIDEVLVIDDEQAHLDVLNQYIVDYHLQTFTSSQSALTYHVDE